MILFYVAIGLFAVVALAKIVSDANIAAEVRLKEKHQAEHKSLGRTSNNPIDELYNQWAK